jgi:hypothetical protein
MNDNREREVNVSTGAAQSSAAGPFHSRLWSRLEPGAIIAAVSGVIVAGIGLLGPTTEYVSKRAEHALAAAQQEHQQLMDFAERVIAAEKIVGDRERTYYRRDVMKFFAIALKPGELKDFARQEAAGLEKVTAQLKELEAKEAELWETQRALTEAQAKVAEAARTQETADTAPKGGNSGALVGSRKALADLQKAEADQAVKRAQERLDAKPTTAQQVSKLRVALGIRATPGTTGGDSVPTATLVPCKQLAADVSTATGIDRATAESACRGADTGASSWTARSGAYYVTCRCSLR